MTFLTEVSGPPVTDVLPPQWLFDQIEQWAKRAPDRPAFVLDHQGQIEEYRYSEVLDHADAISNEMVAQGIRHGNHISILIKNTPE